MATKWVFMAGGDACGACSALAGTVSDVPISNVHENCMCDSIPLSAGEDCPSYTFANVGTQRYGPHGASARVYFDVEVTCCDGSTIGETVEVDLGVEPGGRSLDDEMAEIEPELDLAAEELADGCPDDGQNVV
jgi:hypothetical protein